MKTLRMIDLVNNSFKNPKSALIANTVVSLINDTNGEKINKQTAQNVSKALRESEKLILELEAMA